jgi:copper(I)-binding protein
VILQLKATIWKPIDVSLQYAVLTVTSETPSNGTTVRIVSNEEAPLTLSAPECNNAAFAAELRTNEPGKQFELAIRTVPPVAGNVQGQITLKTSSTNMPVISVGAMANVQPVVVATPSVINLPRAPLANLAATAVTIRNNGTNTLALSEPAASAPGVDVQLRETEPGRGFALTANFPAGFEIARGEKVELSVRSNHPQFPTIKVPVVQPPRPGPPAAPAEPAAGGAASQ